MDFLNLVSGSDFNIDQFIDESFQNKPFVDKDGKTGYDHFKEEIKYDDSSIKVLVVGSKGIGKTYFLNDSDKPVVLSAIQIFTRPGLNIFDLAGDFVEIKFIEHIIKTSPNQVVVFMYNATNEQSFLDLETYWIPTTKSHELNYLFELNHSGERVVSQERARELADKHGLIFKEATEENLCSIAEDYSVIDTPEKKEERITKSKKRIEPKPLFDNKWQEQVAKTKLKEILLGSPMLETASEFVEKIKNGEKVDEEELISKICSIFLASDKLISKEEFQEQARKLEEEEKTHG